MLEVLPPLRPDVVPRTRLVRRLVEARDVPIALVVAPAGFGKSTLLAEWAAEDERSFGWMSLASRPARDAVRAVLRMIDTRAERPRVLVVDDAQLAEPDAIRRLLDAAAGLPRGAMLALSSRRYPDGPIGRLRAQRLMVELAARELAMTRLEAERLLGAPGAGLDGAVIDRLYRSTEGWPAALHLAAVSLAEQRADGAVEGFSGADRLVAEFLRDELLAQLTAPQRRFLRRTSILPRLTAPLCDAVLQSRGAANMLDELVRSGVPLTPLDRCDMAFRCHPLLSAMLRGELARLEPQLEGELHRRAAAWHSGRAEPAEALEHAVAGRDRAAIARLLWWLAPGFLAHGREGLLAQRLGVYSAREVHADAALSLMTAAQHLAEGSRGQAELALEAAERVLAGRPGDESPAAAVLRACIARGGVRQMAADAARARSLATVDGGWHAVGLLLEGVALHLAGDRHAASRLLAEALCRAGELPALTATCHAQLALLAAEAEDSAEAAWHAREAHSACVTGGAPRPVYALALAVDAVVAADRGEVAQARHDAADARRLLAAGLDFPPWVLAEAHVWLARAEIRLSDGPAARMLLARAARLAAQVPDATVLAGWVHDGWALADAFAASATGDGPTLTNAELRVLRFLPSHMSFRQIGEQLHLSTNTVKTQALSVYRKLDVSCRSDAVARGRVAGLIDG
jgi:LuxR family transcriptional regulator, maltose regulon positive regulatory protein